MRSKPKKLWGQAARWKLVALLSTPSFFFFITSFSDCTPYKLWAIKFGSLLPGSSASGLGGLVPLAVSGSGPSGAGRGISRLWLYKG